MAKVQTSRNNYAPKKAKIKRPGVVAKTRTSKLKSSKHYKKKYIGQG
jgi:hypothetical protein